MSGTSLIENFPITVRGITVLNPEALKAPSIPGIEIYVHVYTM